MPRSYNLGDAVAAVGIIYTIVVGVLLVMPMLNRPAKLYFLFLLAWSVPYSIGYVCDVKEIGPTWARWHLVDSSYEQWSTTLGITAYALLMKLLRRPISQQSLFLAGGVSLTAFTAMTYAWEFGQGMIGWMNQGRGNDPIDNICFAIGMLVTLMPLLAFRRPRVVLYARTH